MTCLAMAALFLVVVTLIPAGGVAFAPIFLGIFLLALVGVLARHTDRKVRQRDVTIDGRGWRGGP